MSTVTPIASYRASRSALDTRGWNLALAFQEVFTAIVRLRHDRQTVTDSEAFRAQMKQALLRAKQEAQSAGYKPEDVQQVLFAVVAFLDESVLGSRKPVFADWPRLPLQTELFGHQIAGEVVFQELQKTLGRADSPEVCDVLEVYALCLLLGFRGRYAAGGSGELHSLLSAVQEKIRRVRGASGPLSPKGLPPSDAVRIVRSDPWIRRLAITACIIFGLTLALFVVFKVLLGSGLFRLGSV
jgi:type VI secretion system protein ImpK